MTRASSRDVNSNSVVEDVDDDDDIFFPVVAVVVVVVVKMLPRQLCRPLVREEARRC